MTSHRAGLQLAFVDWHGPENNRAHHTAETSSGQLAVRRGQPFALTLHFHSRNYQPGFDSMYLSAETGPGPEQAIFPVGLSQPHTCETWRASGTSSGPRSTDVRVSAPAVAPIGRYQLNVHFDSGQGLSSSYQLGEFLLLFNAWCPDDDVYLESEAERQEYLLNEHGIIFHGNKNWIHPVPWNYGQFEEETVGICLKLLDSNLQCQHHPVQDCALRSSPVYVSRVLSAMVNSNDDAGVLLGNWSEDYSGGTRPSEWNSSIAILRQWERSGGQPVKYGQCWVFAAVMCTVMRGLGIPTRVVTNFDSGHEKDGNLVIDIFYDNTGQLLPRESKDSIWNFHVWNECWMARRDLPPGYDGWQVLDATPQESSNGLYRCGPAPVRAIREGDIHLRYDTPFVFSMVNADRVVWLLSGTKREKLQWNPSAVGNHISTKSIGSDAREDITHTYKHQEGSLGERQVFLKALAHSQPFSPIRPGPDALPATPDPLPRVPALHDDRAQDPPAGAQTSLHLQLAESPEVGQDIYLTLLARNLEFASKALKLSLSAQPVLHNGHPLPPFWQDTMYLSFSPKEEKRIPWLISYGQYGRHLQEDKQIRVVAMGEENTSWEKALAEKTITVASPPLGIHVLTPVVVNQAFRLRVEFANPLAEPVSDGLLTVEGGGLVRGQAQIELGFLAARQQASITLQLTPYKSGPRQLHVSLRSSLFPPLKGHKQLQVAGGGLRARRQP
ncbi:protein-glutamine gamma-glutamyltransferase 5 [Python bivittatus]|uniref:protein-glutamine gamma-glutamyltransferase n=1 Tax=Python bivittatus TaxID=176946 RepID=A0A9F5N4C8_PYTBI|nr:protein-glutamine gamma-glutamyltransferase 5 [Python bivittatus]